MFTFELIIALPDRPAVLVGRVLHLCSVVSAAVTADDGGGESAFGAEPPTQLFSPGDFCLHQIPFVWIDDGWVAVLHIVLRYFALIGLHFLLQEIHSESFLKPCVTPIFLISEDAVHSGDRPFLFAAGSGDTISSERLGNGAGGLTLTLRRSALRSPPPPEQFPAVRPSLCGNPGRICKALIPFRQRIAFADPR